MSDQVLVCQNCQSEFVFSAGEQEFYRSKGLETPKLCPICRSLKKQENLHPPKPNAPSPIKSSTPDEPQSN